MRRKSLIEGGRSRSRLRRWRSRTGSFLQIISTSVHSIQCFRARLTVLIGLVTSFGHAAGQVGEEWLVGADAFDVELLAAAEVAADTVASAFGEAGNADGCDDACEERCEEDDAGVHGAGVTESSFVDIRSLLVAKRLVELVISIAGLQRLSLQTVQTAKADTRCRRQANVYGVVQSRATTRLCSPTINPPRVLACRSISRQARDLWLNEQG